MMKAPILSAGILLIAAGCMANGEAQPEVAPNAEISAAEEITSHLSGKAFIVEDLEASIAFYSQILGYKVVRRRQIDSEATTSVFGLPPGTVIDYINLVPAEFSEDKPHFPGLNLVGVPAAQATSFPQDAARAPQISELVMAFEVTNLDLILERAQDMGLQIVAPLALSSTGLSQTLTVLDPNGIRVQMYEYVKTDP